MKDKFSNHVKNILHGFFLAIGTTIAEPATILPLIVTYFGGSSIVVGFYTALLKGGAFFVQLYAAYHAVGYNYMLPYMRRVFWVRFLSWAFIGVVILLLSNISSMLTLVLIGVGLFFFSFSAGFGGIYFKEIVAKIFTHKFRGKTMAYRQFFTAFGAIISGTIAAIVLNQFEAPDNFGYLFLLSAFVMGLGFIAFGTVEEPVKENVGKKASSFSRFLVEAWEILKVDKQLQVQVTVFLLAYAYLLSLPFIILDAKTKIELSGTVIGTLITAQMVGAMFSNIVWGKLTSKGYNKATTLLALSLTISAIALAMIANTLEMYLVIFALLGAATDGTRLAAGNLILIIAPEEKRPTYAAIQMNITSFGFLFSLLGGVILYQTSYSFLYSITIVLLTVALVLALGLKEEEESIEN
jgi:MFS family permease